MTMLHAITLAGNGTFVSEAHGVSGDGSIVVGNRYFSTGEIWPFIWTAAAGLRLLSPAAGYTNASALEISSDGTITLGHYWNGTGPGYPTMWRGNVPSVIPIPTMTIGDAGAAALSADGQVIVGHYGLPDFARGAFIHTPSTGTRDLAAVLRTAGASGLDGLTYMIATTITPDGRTIVGTINASIGTGTYIATLGSRPCWADWDESGGVDGGDVEAFFRDWESGNGDADGDGSTDGSDVERFFTLWEQGC
jgi:uncharacterized membrane protein